MILPCRHQARVTQQVQPAASLLASLDVLHPDVLREHSIEPADYKAGLVFRSAIESIRGTFIASSTTKRQSLVGEILQAMYERNLISRFKQTSSSTRTDFEVLVEAEPNYYAAIEVKGGEGNSINISERPLWANEFCLWCHLDGAIVNQPEHGAHAILNRITNELCRRGKQVDALFFKDVLCGTRTRPCPKYPDKEETIGLSSAPDVFLFPKRAPSLEDPNPDVHTLDSLALPRKVLQAFDVDAAAVANHVWQVHVRLVQLPSGGLQRAIEIWYQGEIVDKGLSRPWRA